MGIKLFENLFDIFEEEGEELFFVGGFVRDLLMARMDDDLHLCNAGDNGPKCFFLREEVFWDDVHLGKKDVDFATSATPGKTLEILKNANIKSVPIGIEFGTIQAILGEMKFEITTFRCAESYTKGSRKPAVVFGKDIEEDLARRDFTINAMAMRQDGTLIDPFGGYCDLVTGILETPIEPEVSFSDDPLRILRFARFDARGVGTPGFITHEAAKQMKSRVHEVSKERAFEEMTKILCAPHPDRGIRTLVQTGVLAELFPELERVRTFKTKGKSKDLWKHVVQVVCQTDPKPEQRWAALFHDVGKPETVRDDGKNVSFHNHEFVGSEIWKLVANRLKTSTDFKLKVAQIIAESGNFADLTGDVTDAAVRRFVHKVGAQGVEDVFRFSMADMTTSNANKKERMQSDLRSLKDRIDTLIERDNIAAIKLPKGTGTVLMQELGLQGRELGDIMKALTQKLVDGDISLDSNFAEEAKKLC